MNNLEKDTEFKAVYKNNELVKVYTRYKKETSSGFVWVDELIPSSSKIIEIKRSEEENNQPTITIKVNGKLEEIFQP